MEVSQASTVKHLTDAIRVCLVEADRLELTLAAVYLEQALEAATRSGEMEP